MSRRAALPITDKRLIAPTRRTQGPPKMPEFASRLAPPAKRPPSPSPAALARGKARPGPRNSNDIYDNGPINGNTDATLPYDRQKGPPNAREARAGLLAHWPGFLLSSDDLSLTPRQILLTASRSDLENDANSIGPAAGGGTPEIAISVSNQYRRRIGAVCSPGKVIEVGIAPAANPRG